MVEQILLFQRAIETTTDIKYKYNNSLPLTYLQWVVLTMLYTDVDGQCDKLWPTMVTSLLCWQST